MNVANAHLGNRFPIGRDIVIQKKIFTIYIHYLRSVVVLQRLMILGMNVLSLIIPTSVQEHMAGIGLIVLNIRGMVLGIRPIILQVCSLLHTATQ
ncbi:MAG: hypothetical protein CMJ19_05285 [Phycisphaeraceae bacterium]|nr:hypothetical protein [Phycisphaeraceae bacterium]